jgi:hypothetical protein
MHRHVGRSHRRHCRGPLSATRLISRFSVNCYTRPACRYASSCDAGLVDSARRICSALWRICLVVVERYIYRKVLVDLRSRAHCMTFVVRCNSGTRYFFPLGTPEGARLCSSSQHCESSRAKTSAGVTKFDDMSRRVYDGVSLRTGWQPLSAPVLNYKISVLSSFTVMQYVQLVILTTLHTMTGLRQNFA